MIKKKKEIENKISNILKDIKLNENKIDEINKLKSNKVLKMLEKIILIYQYLINHHSENQILMTCLKC